MSVAISIEDLTYTYRQSDRPALQNIQGQIEDGTFVVVMGYGGAGKSTLCCALNGLVPRFFRGEYQGRVVVRGQEVARYKVAEMSRIVGLVLQDFEAQLFSTNVELEMAFGPGEPLPAPVRDRPPHPALLSLCGPGKTAPARTGQPIRRTETTPGYRFGAGLGAEGDGNGRADHGP